LHILRSLKDHLKMMIAGWDFNNAVKKLTVLLFGWNTHLTGNRGDNLTYYAKWGYIDIYSGGKVLGVRSAKDRRKLWIGS
jgi:hypothetical protein